MGRRAAFLDGPDVWQVLEPYIVHGRDLDSFHASWDHLEPRKLDTALRFYDLYPAEVESRIACNNTV